jgi:hypothetical protein
MSGGKIQNYLYSTGFGGFWDKSPFTSDKKPENGKMRDYDKEIKESEFAIKLLIICAASLVIIGFVIMGLAHVFGW